MREAGGDKSRFRDGPRPPAFRHDDFVDGLVEARPENLDEQVDGIAGKFVLGPADNSPTSVTTATNLRAVKRQIWLFNLTRNQA